MRRRDMIAGTGMLMLSRGAAAQVSSMRTIGYLSPRSIGTEGDIAGHLRIALRDMGFVEGRNLRLEFRWADGRYELLPGLAAELVQASADVILTTGGPQPARAAISATSTTPIVFLTGGDPVRDGLVRNVSRPEGRVTGFVVFAASLGPKRLDLLRELVPGAGPIGFLVNPSSEIAQSQMIEVGEAAQRVNQRLEIVSASSEAEIDRAFATLAERRVDALLMSADLFFQVRRAQLVALSKQYRLPTMFEWPQFVEAGGLASYSADSRETWSQCGVYLGRILNGAKIADLPVTRSTRFKLVVNLRAAQELGIAIPPAVLARADDIID